MALGPQFTLAIEPKGSLNISAEHAPLASCNKRSNWRLAQWRRRAPVGPNRGQDRDRASTAFWTNSCCSGCERANGGRIRPPARQMADHLVEGLWRPDILPDDEKMSPFGRRRGMHRAGRLVEGLARGQGFQRRKSAFCLTFGRRSRGLSWGRASSNGGQPANAAARLAGMARRRSARRGECSPPRRTSIPIPARAIAHVDAGDLVALHDERSERAKRTRILEVAGVSHITA